MPVHPEPSPFGRAALRRVQNLQSCKFCEPRGLYSFGRGFKSSKKIIKNIVDATMFLIMAPREGFEPPTK